MDKSSSQSVFHAIPWTGKAILLVDLDAFFASVEQRDHPDWRGKPVIVGGDPDKRGVVSTASYEARVFGVHSAMPSSQAKRLCPQAIWTHGHFDRYREMSNQIMKILSDETPYVQQVSIDEAFLDVTPTKVNTEHPIQIAMRIQQRVEDLGVTCSIGIGSSKTIAKIASEMDKPRGLTIVYPGTEKDFLSPLPVLALSGIGPSAETKLKKVGITTLGQLAQTPRHEIERMFGKAGSVMHIRANGGDDSGIVTDESIKSVSNETSFAKDLTKAYEVEAAIATMASKVGRRLRKKNLKGSTLALRIRYGDRTVRSIQTTLAAPSNDDLEFIPKLYKMLRDIWHEGMPVRLVGVAMTGFDELPESTEQLSLFEIEDNQTNNHEDFEPLIAEPAKRRKLLDATDSIRDRFGDTSVQFGSEMRSYQNTTGSSSKNVADYK